MMKKFKLLLVAPLLMMSSCTTTEALQNAPVIGKICAAADAKLVDEKTYYTALQVYDVVAYTYLRLNREGKLSSGLKAQVKPMVQELYKYVGVIKAAKGSVNCDMASMLDLRDRITEILPKGV